ncbi:MAG: hypothetical protein H6502_04720 [Candidatus Woesearchaeota archaeon]|nr:MAG: hypothetical protein H6502_04720 [Candidatus Woesearchaeota archaeon]
MNLSRAKENGVTFFWEQKETVRRNDPVFYNPRMQFNRDVSVAVVNAYFSSPFTVGLPLAGSGVRGLRMAKECARVEHISMNDHNPVFVTSVKQSIKENKFALKQFSLSSVDANEFLLASKGFDYVDIDPFGSPNQFLGAALSRTRRGGIVAVTATDTSALCGTYRDACKRKYWANPLHDEEMHEIGLRILVRKVQLLGAQFDKALTPVLSYTLDHYMRGFFRFETGKKKVDAILEQHQLYEKNGKQYGPIWTGPLKDAALIAKIDHPRTEFQFLKNELDVVGYYDTHTLASELKTGEPIKIDVLLAALKNKGFLASRTHFCLSAIKTTASRTVVEKIIRGNP